MCSYLTRRGSGQRSAMAYTVASLLGVAVAGWLVPVAALTGAAALAHPPEGDIGQHIIGQRYFIADAWRWPLLVARGLGWPEGTNIAFTDSIPLEALVLKLLRGWLPLAYEGVHLWLALCYALQPVAAVFALRGTGERRWWPSAVVAVLALAMPALWFRFIHPALSSHFLLLVALGFYLRLCRDERWALAAAACLPPVLLLVHPYLLVMGVAVLAAAPVTLAVRRQGGAVRAGLAVGAGTAAAVALAWLLGYGEALPLPGFGAFSMNLLSPVYPEVSGLLPGWRLPYAAAEQNDGYNYLGAGVLLLAVLAAPLVMRRVTRHAGLALCCLALTALALSSRGYAGHWLMWQVRHVPEIVEQFRGSGRLFWPVAYTIVVAGVAALARSGRLAGVALLGVTVLQVADATAIAGHDRAELRRREAWQFDPAVVASLLRGRSVLNLVPKFACGGDFLGDVAFRELSELASAMSVPINTVYAARLAREPDCNSGVAAPIDADELRVFVPAAVHLASDVPNAIDLCHPYQNALFCGTGILERFALLDLGINIPIDHAISAGEGGVPDFLGAGWCEREKGGTWTCSKKAVLLLHFGATVHPTVLSMTGQALASTAGGIQAVSVSFDGQVIASLQLADREVTTSTIKLPAITHMMKEHQLIFTITNPVTPQSRSLNGDGRHLGYWLSSIVLR